MRVAVVGAGAMGCTFGGYLSRAGNDVYLIDVWREHIETIQRDGLRIEEPGGSVTVFPNASPIADDIGPCELVLILVKSMHTAIAARSALPLLGSESIVLTLQNGLGNVEQIVDVVGAERVLAGVTYRGGEVLGPGIVRPSGADKETIIGEVDGRISTRTVAIIETFTTAGILAQASNSVWSEIWGKFLVNVAGNALSAITRMRLGQLMHSPSSRTLVEQLANEAAEVAQRLGIALPYPDPVTRIEENWRNLQAAKSSMLQDLEKGRKTEIDALNGYVVRQGARHGVPTPANSAITLLVKSLEDAQELIQETAVHGAA